MRTTLDRGPVGPNGSVDAGDAGGHRRLRTYRDATAFLESLVRTPSRTREERERLGLYPIESLLDRIGNPHRELAAIHITGSKGKGSTALYLEALLAAAGLRIGTFTSPHLEHWNERIRIVGAPIGRGKFVAAMERVRPVIADLHRADADTAPAFFDALVAAAFSAFADAGVDIAVIEAGIGARLDPTRACRAAATCVTSVEMEHADRLGPALTDIAREKAAVARAGVPLVVGSIPAPASTVVERETVRIGAPLRRLGRDIGIRWRGAHPATDAPAGAPGHRTARRHEAVHTVAPAGAGEADVLLPGLGAKLPKFAGAPVGAGEADALGRAVVAEPRPRAGTFPGTEEADILLPGRTIRIGLRQPGRHMIENAALALALAHEVGALRLLDDAAASSALEATDLPGRAEVLREVPLVITDGAHTSGSIAALVRILDARRSTTLVAVVSITRGKDAPSVLSSLVRQANVVIATAVEPSRSLAAEALARDLREAAPHAAIEAIDAPADALQAAMCLAGRDGIVCATGSMYMAGAARRILGPRRRRPTRTGHPPVSDHADVDAGAAA